MSDKVTYIFELVDKGSRPADNISAKLDKLSDKTRAATTSNGSFFNSFGKTAAIAAAGYAIYNITGKVTDFTRESLHATGMMEKFQATLEVMLDSKKSANARMAEYTEIATKTPFELSEVVEAGNKLQSLGKYSRENMLLLGDLAAASGKPFQQVLDAYAKMVTGQKGEAVNMFRDLLITSTDWTEATGKGMSKNGELMATTEEMLLSLSKIVEKKGFAGMMAKQSEKLLGIESNLNDSYFQLQATIGERLAPAYKSALGWLSGIIEKTKKWIEIKPSEKIEDERREVNLLAKELKDAETPYNRRKEILNELKGIQPDIVKGLSEENINYGKLNQNLAQYNINAIKRIALEQLKEDILIGVQDEAGEAEKQFQLAEEKLYSYFTGDIFKRLSLAGKGTEAGNILKDQYQIYIRNMAKEFAHTIGGPSMKELIKKIEEKTGIGLSQHEIDVISVLEKERRYTMAKSYQLTTQAGDAQKRIEDFAKRMGIVLDETFQDPGNLNNPVNPSDLLKKEYNSITGDVKAQKVINIYIDKQIETVNNSFSPGQNPVEATDFMTKLTNALQSIVNDVNYTI